MNKGQQLEELLTTAFLSLRQSEQLTEEKIDIPFLLNIVGSYITAKEQDKLDADVKVPAVIFNERIFPMIEESTLVIEDIPQDDGE
jgi:hypothetical protein